MPSPSKKIPKWSDAQRTVLNLLNTQFDLDVDIRTQVFNIVFEDDLEQAGIHDGLDSAQLKSQWRDRNHKGREHLWQSALQAPRNDAEKTVREGLVERIQDAAAAVGVSTEGGAIAGSGDGDKAEDRGDDSASIDRPQSRNVRNALKTLAVNGKPAIIGSRGRKAGEKSTAHDDSESRDTGKAMTSQGWYADEEAEALSDEEESSDAEEEVDDDDYVDASNRRSKTVASKPDEDILEMLHTKDINWNAEGAFIKSLEGATIARTSSYYKHGGEVRRITILSNGTDADFMLCDASICPACSDPSAPLVLSPDEALPFIHSSDTAIIQKRTYFTPKAKCKPQGRTPTTFLRYVQFKGLDGDVAAWVRICGFVGCDVCMSGKKDTQGGVAGSELEAAEAENDEIIYGGRGSAGAEQ